MLSLFASRLCASAPLNHSVRASYSKISSVCYSSFGNARKNILCGKIIPRSPVVSRTSGTISLKVESHAIGSSKVVGLWLLGCSGLVFGAVILGGVTRLTEAGLSMVTWTVLGEKRPITEQEWIEEFERYKQYPEYKTKHTSITLEEFKRIWWMEYVHRTWGRLIGGAFLLPAAYFWMKGRFDRSMKIRVAVFGALIGAQGLMGYYMVKSGLEDRFHGPSDIARVSQYRLASHLGLAFILYTGFLWSALDSLLPAQTLARVTQGATRFRMLAHACKGMVFLTAFSGAFVAGLDAGLVYNSFPKMGDYWIPDDIMTLQPKLRNITENPVTVQFDHRILGLTTLGMISSLWYLARKRHLPKRAYIATHALATMAWMQVLLGITTLVHYVPVSLAAIHQSGSLLLLSMAIWLTHEMKYVKRFAK